VVVGFMLDNFGLMISENRKGRDGVAGFLELLDLSPSVVKSTNHVL
jgi:hypothetical protein